MPNLTEFYCAENEITTFEHITNVPQLKKLHLRSN